MKNRRTAAQLMGQTVKGYGTIIDVKRKEVKVRTSRGLIWIPRPA